MSTTQHQSVCPYCRASNNAEAVRCRSCGFDLSPWALGRATSPLQVRHTGATGRAITEFNNSTRSLPLSGGEIEDVNAGSMVARAIRRMATNLNPGETTYGICAGWYHLNNGVLWLTNRRLMHVTPEFSRLSPGPTWAAHSLVEALGEPGGRSTRLTIYRRGGPPLVFKRARGCQPIVDAINRARIDGLTV